MPIVLLAFTVEQVLELSICYLNINLTQPQSWYQIESCDPLAVILQVTQFYEQIYKKGIRFLCTVLRMSYSRKLLHHLNGLHDFTTSEPGAEF